MLGHRGSPIVMFTATSIGLAKGPIRNIQLAAPRECGRQARDIHHHPGRGEGFGWLWYEVGHDPTTVACFFAFFDAFNSDSSTDGA